MCTYIIERAQFRSNIGKPRENSGTCDVCRSSHRPRLHDGPTKFGIWAWMCDSCLAEHGCWAATTIVREETPA